MAPNKRVGAAYRAMASLGVDESKVKSVLKKLLKVYDKNWELIEEENYRVLADAIFEDDDNMVPELKRKSQTVDAHNTHHSLSSSLSNNLEEETECEEAQMHVETARPLKRLPLRGQEIQPLHPSTNSAPSPPSKKFKSEDSGLPGGCSGKKPQNKAVSSDGNPRIEAHVSPRDGIVDKGKQPASTQVSHRGRRLASERVSPSIPSKEPTVEPGKILLPNNQMSRTHVLLVPKDEPVDELPDYEMPIAVIPPEPSNVRDSSMKNGVAGKHGDHVTMSSSQHRGRVRDEDIPTSNGEATCNVEIASSTLGEVKLSLSCSSALQGSGFHMPSQDQLLQKIEDKCLRSYKIIDPKFSVSKLLRDICDCMLEFRTNSSDDSREGSIIRSGADVSKESQENHGTPNVGESKDLDMLSGSSNGSIDVNASTGLVSLSPRRPFSLTHLSGMDDAVLVSKMDITDFSQNNGRKEPEGPTSPNSRSLVVVPQHNLTTDDMRSIHDVNDLTKGEEDVKISWVNETTNDFAPPFNYIPQNLVFQDAYVCISLSHIGGEDCCSTCMGNCILSSTPCACANKTGSGFAYTAQGLLKEELLEECIAISHNPQQNFFYCKDCPLERSKNDGCLEPCKGHLKRKFIKECWSKCGCGKQCGNRVIQRGITCNLQVFFTSEGKGWGLRTLEDLPKGAFVCEFVGEILTIKELQERNLKCNENGKYTYPVLLDANWDSGHVKDEEALCLDAASFGNTARFINHRCFDANLVEIPVEVEDPSHYYYHFAFFTSRKIAAREELTWDYGIDFDDHDHLVKLFQCRCGSKFCRNMKRSNRSIRSASNAI
ncbi:probable inactive histone-lysine N-methyltransferase SUVR2 [Cajanus cajan]|uniref:probable inactive histone-lysine N-methyltransferase SUVR2 n=1 Tax=Cajanus cajan TaxID=3821 RepID=UPI00098DB85D|nr:probable inactive histone-lysine N-methyltransferase SUVR2 [Cajanus cajan]XP_020237116.1 probable inactive histone-lysine N-methyltransferase SUVR2 [Cajanus cajan]XP_029125344.1 probable inactive histone-lysine N-methyltransferase SUVR2 [Cajanus cajan]